MLDFLAMSALELIVLCGLIVFLLIGTAFDRRGHSGLKWWALVLLGVAWALSHDWSGGVWSVMRLLPSLSSLIPVTAYILVGLLAYSPVEYRMELKRSARRMKEVWDTFLSKNPSVREKKFMPADEQAVAERAEKAKTEERTITEKALDALKHAGVKVTDEMAATLGRTVSGRLRVEDDKPTPEQLVAEFVAQANHGQQGYVSEIVLFEAKGIEVDYKVNRNGLVRSVMAWTFLWPFYLVSLVFGNFVIEFFEIVIDKSRKWAEERLRKAFADVFVIEKKT